MSALLVPIAPVFRPRLARYVAWGIGVAQTIAVGAVAVLVATTPSEQLQTVAMVVLVDGVLWQLARIQAVPTEEALVVRNVIHTTSVDWAQIVAVRTGVGASWVSLDMDDGTSLPVMAIQNADGEYFRREAQRLATLVHTRR